MKTLDEAIAISRSAFPQYPTRAVRWVLRTRELLIGKRPLLMGIVNVTPDSFSDGGRFQSVDRALEQAMSLAAAGADILDIGGESTRPYAVPVSESEELKRVMPVLARLRDLAPVPLSIDTYKANVAREAISAGVEIINDVTGLEGDSAMLDQVRDSGAAVCVMHMHGTPQTMQDDPQYTDVVHDIFAYLRNRRDALARTGIQKERICLDPGVGFGKTHQHNLTLLAACHQFHDLGCPVLVGHSRKGFIARVLNDKDTDRMPGSIGTALALARQGIQILRVHDVAAVRQALLLFEATGGIDGQPLALA